MSDFSFDVAVLDANLNGRSVVPVARYSPVEAYRSSSPRVTTTPEWRRGLHGAGGAQAVQCAPDRRRPGPINGSVTYQIGTGNKPVRLIREASPGNPRHEVQPILVGAALTALSLAACSKPANSAAQPANPSESTAASNQTAGAPAPCPPRRRRRPPRPLPGPAFASAMAASDMFEITEAKIAEKKATNPDVKAFARMMITDHTKSTDHAEGRARARPANPSPRRPPCPRTSKPWSMRSDRRAAPISTGPT